MSTIYENIFDKLKNLPNCKNAMKEAAKLEFWDYIILDRLNIDIGFYILDNGTVIKQTGLDKYEFFTDKIKTLNMFNKLIADIAYYEKSNSDDVTKALDIVLEAKAYYTANMCSEIDNIEDIEDMEYER